MRPKSHPSSKRFRWITIPFVLFFVLLSSTTTTSTCGVIVVTEAFTILRAYIPPTRIMSLPRKDQSYTINGCGWNQHRRTSKRFTERFLINEEGKDIESDDNKLKNDYQSVLPLNDNIQNDKTDGVTDPLPLLITDESIRAAQTLFGIEKKSMSDEELQIPFFTGFIVLLFNLFLTGYGFYVFFTG